jgi:hypothetical protein
MKLDLHLDHAYSAIKTDDRTIYLYGNGAYVVKENNTNEVMVQYNTGDIIHFVVANDDYKVVRIKTHDGINIVID